MTACNRRTESSSAKGTETIAPAAPQPAQNTDSDVMTQTTNIEDSRSEAEGGALTQTSTAKTTTSPPPTRTTT